MKGGYFYGAFCLHLIEISVGVGYVKREILPVVPGIISKKGDGSKDTQDSEPANPLRFGLRIQQPVLIQAGSS